MPFDNAGFVIKPRKLSHRERTRLRVLKTARDQIAQRELWCQRSFILEDARCAIGWLVEVSGSVQQARAIIRLHLFQSLPEDSQFTRWTPFDSIMAYNDSCLTSHTGIVALFNRAIDQLENDVP